MPAGPECQYLLVDTIDIVGSAEGVTHGAVRPGPIGHVPVDEPIGVFIQHC
jgi:hypothetical protein